MLFKIEEYTPKTLPISYHWWFYCFLSANEPPAHQIMDHSPKHKENRSSGFIHNKAMFSRCPNTFKRSPCPDLLEVLEASINICADLTRAFLNLIFKSLFLKEKCIVAILFSKNIMAYIPPSFRVWRTKRDFGQDFFFFLALEKQKNLLQPLKEKQPILIYFNQWMRSPRDRESSKSQLLSPVHSLNLLRRQFFSCFGIFLCNQVIFVSGQWVLLSLECKPSNPSALFSPSKVSLWFSKCKPSALNQYFAKSPLARTFWKV